MAPLTIPFQIRKPILNPSNFLLQKGRCEKIIRLTSAVFLDTQPKGYLKKANPMVRRSFLIGTMKNSVIKSLRIILPIVLFFLFSCASTEQKQSESRDAEFYNSRGIAYGEKGQYDEAISDYNKALEINQSYAEAYRNRGNAYFYKRQYDQAISDYNKALEINPKYAKAYNNRGVIYRLKGQYDQAISDYDKALEIDAGYADAYNNRGVAYYFKGEYEKSWEDVKKAQNLGHQIHPKFLENLRKASGR